MNFLAHLYLSHPDPYLTVGNFIGDFLRGSQLNDFPEDVQKGIIMHREIDAFTDDNDIVRQSKHRLIPKYRHYSAVIVDMYYDHFLATLWDDYHPQPLESFTRSNYELLKEHWEILPEKARYVLPHMERHNWLLSYAQISGLGQALAGLARRSRFESHMEHATEDLKVYYSDFRNEFISFFPKLIAHIEQWKKENLTP